MPGCYRVYVIRLVLAKVWPAVRLWKRCCGVIHFTVNTLSSELLVAMLALAKRLSDPLKKAIGNPFENKSITLSCGKLYDGCDYTCVERCALLRNTDSPETYFQTAFRAQSPWTYREESTSDKFIAKPTCYIFDFAPSRALKLISEYSVSLDVNDTPR